MNFNSIKVRLERTGEEVGVILRSFQFHKGAIRTEALPVWLLVDRISIP